MRPLRRFWRRMQGAVFGARLDEEFAAEIETHLRLLADEYERQGMTPAEARRAAALTLGGVEATKEQWRRQRGLPRVEALWRDVRFAVRGLAARPGFTSACVLTLALAIGANVAIFSLIDRVVLRPLDVPDPSGLVTLQQTYVFRGEQVRRTTTGEALAQQFRGMAAFESAAMASHGNNRGSGPVAASIGGRGAGAAEIRFVTANYFRVLGLRLPVGRDFVESDDIATASPVAIVSHRFWRTRLGGEEAAVGRTIEINGHAVTVVGVAPRTFTGTDLYVTPPDLFLPLMTASRLTAETQSDTEGPGLSAGGATAPDVQRPSISPVRELMVVGRIAPGTDLQAQAELAAVLGASGYPTPEQWRVVPLADTMLPFESQTDLRRFLGLLAGAVGLTLLIGCANLAGLLLARTEERRVELALRAALGAGRARLVREVAVDASVLAFAGGIAALLVAHGLDRGLSMFVLPGNVTMSSLRGWIDARTLTAAALATALAALVIGLAPAVRAARRHLALEINGRGGGAPRLGLMRALVAVQVAICVVLVFGAALFVRTLSNALATDLGFDPRGLVSVSLSMPSEFRMNAGRLRPGDSINALDMLVTRARATPVISAATIGPLPLLRGADGSTGAVRIDGVSVVLSAPADVVYAADDYFTTLGQPVVRGRDFEARDQPKGQLVAIVNEMAARQFWPDRDALGGQVGFPRGGGAPVIDAEFTVVGIVRDAKLRTLGETERPAIYLARSQHQDFLAGFAAGSGSTFLIVRSQGRLPEVTRALADATAYAGFPLQSITTLEAGLREMLMPQRLGRVLLGLLGTLALALTVVGIYGLVACLVARQRKEIGVRMALGARTPEIVRSLLARTAVPLLIGVIVGAGAAWYGGTFADRFMYGMRGSDPLTIGMAVATIAAGGALATLLPLRRALRIDPIETLRTE